MVDTHATPGPLICVLDPACRWILAIVPAAPADFPVTSEFQVLEGINQEVWKEIIDKGLAVRAKKEGIEDPQALPKMWAEAQIAEIKRLGYFPRARGRRWLAPAVVVPWPHARRRLPLRRAIPADPGSLFLHAVCWCRVLSGTSSTRAWPSAACRRSLASSSATSGPLPSPSTPCSTPTTPRPTNSSPSATTASPSRATG